MHCLHKGFVAVILTLLVSGCAARAKTDGVSPDSLTPLDWVSLSKPSSSHQLLDMFAGTWDVQVSSWSDPKASPDISSGLSRSKWILGNRFLEERFEGSAGGQYYKGRGIMGYDGGARVFTSVWMDSLNTSMAISKGTFSPESKTFELLGEVYDPLMGRTKETHTEIRLVSNDEYEINMIDTAPNGRKFRSLSLVYRRKKEVS
jgi:hypothetical protein